MLCFYTVCTLNHLAQAKVLARSIGATNLDCPVYIGIIDKIPLEIIKNEAEFNLLSVEELNIAEFAEMREKYALFELCCACKPFFAEYLFQNYAHITKLIYLDTDIRVFGSFAAIENDLDKKDIILTPHTLTPIEDSLSNPQDQIFLTAGIYNAGFFALRKSAETARFLRWWGERLKIYCFNLPQSGLCCDQTWLNFVPIFFKSVEISENYGLNVAYWNLHERKITRSGETFFVENGAPLIFFHYSGYDFERPNQISKFQNRYTIADFPELQLLFAEYKTAVIAENYDFYKSYPNSYKSTAKNPHKKSFKSPLSKFAALFKNNLNKFIYVKTQN